MVTTDSTVLERPATKGEADRTEILDRFRKEHPELAEAMQLAAETEKIWEEFERATQPTVFYSVSNGTLAR